MEIMVRFVGNVCYFDKREDGKEGVWKCRKLASLFLLHCLLLVHFYQDVKSCSIVFHFLGLEMMVFREG
jgi:hypothetical protein